MKKKTAKRKASKGKAKPKAKPITKAKSKTTKKAKPKSTRWTFKKMKALNAQVGSGLQHTDRKYSSRVHQGKGGIYFTFKNAEETGWRVREFFTNGHTSVNAFQPQYKTQAIAHRVAAALAKNPREKREAVLAKLPQAIK